ncbi:MAG: FAD-dependent oxidoreductase [Lachnospirales bacterium]
MKKKKLKKSFVLLLVCIIMSYTLIGCTSTDTTQTNEEKVVEEPAVESESTTKFKPGVYTGESEGYGGALTVEVEVDEENILSVSVTENSETESVASKALAEIPKAIVDNQSVAVDSVTGATLASNAVIEATTNALLESGATLESISTEVAKAGEGNVEVIDTDVVVVGAGGSGTAAAVTAAENGANVVVLEKTAIPGGTTANGGGFFAADSEMSRAIGHEALDVDMIFEKWMNEMDWLANASLVRQFLDTSATTADWLQEHGLVFHKMEEAVQQSHAEGTNGYHKYDDYTQTSAQLGAMLDKIVEENDATVLYETPAYELIIDGDTVTGVLAEGKDGTLYEINADSVIIASGGFVGNDEMVSNALNGVTVNASGYNTNTGDGINMGLDLGAATRAMDAMVLHTFSVDGGDSVTGEYDFMEKYQATNSVAYMPIIPWLDAKGFRYANEDIVYDRALSTNALVAQGNYAWFLYNEELLQTLETEGAGAAGMTEAIAMGPMPEITPINSRWSNLTTIVDEMVQGGAVKKADTLSDLAEFTGMDEEVLIETMETYNNDALAGVDSVFAKEGTHMYPLIEGPYYAFKVSANNLSTAGGLRINANFQVVLDDPENGYTPIENLYCAGADAGGIYSDHYAHTIEGAAQGWAYNSGRLAGARATENALGIDIDL